MACRCGNRWGGLLFKGPLARRLHGGGGAGPSLYLRRYALDGPIRGFPFWSLDATVSKDFKATERIGATLTFQFVNLLNHFVPSDPTTNIDTQSSFGVVTNQFTTPNGAQNRSIEFGLRIRF